MATYNKFTKFIEDLTGGATRVHNLQSDQLKVAFTNVAPSASDAVLSDLTEINYANLPARELTTTSWSNTGGTMKLIVEDLTLVATGTVAPFQYVVLYNDTATNKNLIGWADRGSAINLLEDDSVTIDFNQADGVFSIS